jgi:hypothetical protein
LIKGKLPPQNKTNDLQLNKIPEELANLSSLESSIFMKITARQVVDSELSQEQL